MAATTKPMPRDTHPDSDRVRDAEAWIKVADMKPGSWWPDYRDWLRQRAGDLKPAPTALGSRKHKARAKAPGSYVHAT